MGNNKPLIYKLKGTIRNYDWGGTTFLPNLLSVENPGGRPMAEYWLGAHDSAPSIIVSGDGTLPLNQFIATEKEEILGETVAKRFGRLPYLLKILDVKEMLSIQVHPSKHTAEVEFAKENKEKIPLDAPNRNYKDDNHKPELMVALSEFWLLHGFKPEKKLRATLESIESFASLLRIFDASGYDQLYKTVMEMPQKTVNDLLKPVLDRILPLYQNNILKKDKEDFWAARASLTFHQSENIDRGIFSIYFFNLVHLAPGEGVFQDAGLPHAYLEGQNVEIMANSDNVLRGGLTNKHIDVKELMKNIKFEETIPHILYPLKTSDHERSYKTGAPDFILSCFKIKQNAHASFESATGEILLIISGKVLISSAKEHIELKKGESAFIASHQKISLEGLPDAEIFKASVPVHKG